MIGEPRQCSQGLMMVPKAIQLFTYASHNAGAHLIGESP